MSEQASSRVVRLRYTGHFAHTLKLAGVVAVPVKHGAVFEVPEKWVYALHVRGTPVEEVAEELETDAPRAPQDTAPTGEELEDETEGDELETDEDPEEAPADEPAKPKRQRKARAKKADAPKPDDAG